MDETVGSEHAWGRDVDLGVGHGCEVKLRFLIVCLLVIFHVIGKVQSQYIPF